MIAEHLEPKGLARDALPIADYAADGAHRDNAKRGSLMLRDAIFRAKGIEPPKRVFTISKLAEKQEKPKHRHDLWTDDELSILYAHFNDRDYLSKLPALLPHRTRGTIQNRMSRLRAEACFEIDRIATQAQLRRDAEEGSAELLHALLEMVRGE